MTVTTAQPTRAELARREAALARVRKYGDPVLRTRARPVAAVDAAVAAQIQAMAAHTAHLSSTADGRRRSTTAPGTVHFRNTADGRRRSYGFSYRAWRFS